MRPKATPAHEIALDLTDKRTSYCQQAAGVARFSYNWALALVQSDAQYQDWKQDDMQAKPLPASRPNAKRFLECWKSPQQLGKAWQNFLTDGRIIRKSKRKAQAAAASRFRTRQEKNRRALFTHALLLSGKTLCITEI